MADEGGQARMVKWNKVLTFFAIVVVLFAIIGFTFKNVTQQVTLGLDLKGGFEILFQIEPEEGKEITNALLLQTKQVLERRISIIGVAEPMIDIEGSDRIRIGLAGVSDQVEARRILATEANLTFRSPTGEILMTGKDLKENGASVVFNELSQPLVSITLQDADLFARITQTYLGQPISIYLDEDMVTNPVVNSVIANGSAVIEGQRTVEEAQELAGLLNAGALPVGLKEISSNSVGASLGQLAMEKGIFAGLVATVIIFIFMLVFYRLPGFIAVITLVTYVYLVLLTMVLMGATLTLPGIAAFILGVGMAVDANIITYERIKDEIRSGKTLLSSFRAGSRRSFLTILDANLTTVIAGIVLFLFGTSAIKGFAVILILGIAVSMLTAVGQSRLLLNMLVRSNWLSKPKYYGVKESEIGEL